MGANLRALSWGPRLGAAFLLLAASGCADVESGDAFEEETSEIHNGSTAGSNDYGVVAVYHIVEDSFLSYWYTHPCTGVVLNPSATNNLLVLTARHCVTPYANPSEGLEGPTLRPFGVRVSAELQPGPQPSAAAVQACEIIAPPSPNDGYLGLNETLDMALVRVCQPIPSLNATANPLYMGSSGAFDQDDGPAFDGISFVMFGYGCYVWDDSATGGILRRSSGHKINSFDHTSKGSTGYDYNAYFFTAGTGNTFLAHGDSGGPSFFTSPGALKVQIGVHNKSNNIGTGSKDVAVSRITNGFIQSVLDRIYIRPQDAMNRALSRSSNQPGAGINAALTANIAQTDLPNRQWFLYDFPTRHIVTANGQSCLRRNGDNTLEMATCSSTSASQKWWVSLANTIGDNTDTLCLKKSGTTGVVLAGCSTTDTSQKWYFDPDSRVAGVY